MRVRTNKKNDMMKTTETTNGKTLNHEDTQFFQDSHSHRFAKRPAGD